MAQIRWFQNQESFTVAAKGMQKAIAQWDIPIAEAAFVNGHCPTCDRQTLFEVNPGAMFAERPNLREGLRCSHCKLTARQRLIMLAMQQEIDSLASPLRGAMLEQTTRLYRVAHARWRWIVGSEYLGDDHVGGGQYWWSTHWWRWRHTRHESITSFSYASHSIDLLAHSDILEHVYDTKQALRECSRILRKGGVMLFTAPFFADRHDSILRGRLQDDGQIKHLEPPEYHGDGMARGGIYTFHNFGWDFFELLRESGFTRVEIGLCHAPDEGLTSADPAAEQPWRMLPLLFRAVK
ncbi:methyltransferase domain-containing protein [Rhodanobacter umsongensis]|uniref:Methyltransferase domain-containing protein n=1 Tax=Rhodanobacter umsongensis TaxID=633153 RepID=A0ABW0JJQ1_9GAMM